MSVRLPHAGRPLLAFAGAGAMALAVVLGGPITFALWLVPDLTLLAGLSRQMPQDGRMPVRAVPFYNAAHRSIGPCLLIGVGLLSGGLVLVLGLVWLSHVLIDRALGYGLRTPEGAQRV